MLQQDLKAHLGLDHVADLVRGDIDIHIGFHVDDIYFGCVVLFFTRL
jgi:hypothetical protein